MGLPHFGPNRPWNTMPSNIILNLFEIIIYSEPSPLLLEHVKKIDLGGDERILIEYTLNRNDASALFVYEQLEGFAKGDKVDARIEIRQFNREGDIYRTVKLYRSNVEYITEITDDVDPDIAEVKLSITYKGKEDLYY